MKVRPVRMELRRDGLQLPCFYYAELDREGICRSLWAFPTPELRPGTVAVETLDVGLLGRRWTGTRWVSAAPERPSHPDPTEPHGSAGARAGISSARWQATWRPPTGRSSGRSWRQRSCT